MALTDDLRKTLTNTNALYVAAGTADLAAQKIRELPATFDRLRAEAPERLPKLREQAQSVALQGVGIALEYAVKAREAYDGLAERGKTVVDRRRGTDGEAPEVTVERAGPTPVTEPVTEPEESAAEAAEAGEAAEAAEAAEADAPKPRARKTAPRRSAPKKTPPQA
ncbi:hypothetical protein [Streptomyces litchfieldiae]|uniref:Heparin binding hemagglutinin HbhA n=1 Tax=Streptomyces litchfieldiae TaxID=3075543 RepID=A0ABU2MPW1_9ACTN|nr:hypothetical protein [Streptomyces sp. DSM 44938]MDT0343393.1 hypothetical protein [Streptomyces sp. DSM 44938]